MAEPFEVIKVDSPHVHCDGGSGALGHPLIYMEMGEKPEVTCPYCSRLFVLKKKTHA
jgi:uncharacterized Zn-finger protein